MQGAWHQKRVKQTVLCGIELNTYKKAPPRCAEGQLLYVLSCMKKRGIGQKKTALKGCLKDYLVGFNGNGNWIVVVGVSSGGV